MSRPVLPLRPLSSLFLAALLSPALAGSYGPQAFSFTNGTTSLGDGTVMNSNTAVTSVQSNALRLLQSGVGGTSSSFKLPDLDPGQEVESFTATFRLRMSTTGTPADGLTVNFGAIPGGDGGGEGGFGMADGLYIAWDTYDNGGDAPSIEIVADGASLANYPQTFSAVHNQWIPVSIHWDSAGLDLTWNGTALATNLAVPGFVPSPGNTLAFSGRTGGATQDAFLDDLEFTTTTSVPLQTGGPVISEFVADNEDVLEDEDLDSPDWIEIYNGQATAVNLAGWTLTNDPLNRTLWTLPAVTVPAYGYLVVFASGKDRPAGTLHTNFTLEKSGGYVALTAPGGAVATSEYTYGPQAADTSYGELGPARTAGYLETPTPGAKNGGLQAPGPPAEDVQFSRAGGLFTGTVSLEILPPVAAGAQVRYTLNNTIPDASSPVYTAPFTITSTTTVRARIFAPDQLPGDVSSRTLLQLSADAQTFTSALPIVVADSHSFNVDLASNPGAARPYRPVYAVTIDRDPVDHFARMTGTADFTGRGGMHVRGQSSSGFPKRQYAWELWNNEDEDSNASLLGMPADSDWVLQAPYSDKTLMRNVVVYDSARRLWGNAGGVRTRFVELFFNQDGGPVSMADYRGVYVLMEKIKRGKERVDVEKLNENVTDPVLITGGYIFKKDKPPYGQPWTTAVEGIPLDTQDPGTLNAAQFSYLTGYVDDFERALHGSSFDNLVSGYAKYIDVPSFIDNHLFVEMFKEIDGYRISSYFSKPRGGKIRALPVWDYNLALGNANYLGGEFPTGWYYPQIGGTDYPWYTRLFQDREFVLSYWDRYWALRRSLFRTADVLGRIDAFDAELDLPNASGGTAVQRNFVRWPILGTEVWPNAAGWATRTTHQSEVDWMKTWLSSRLDWIDTQSQGTAGTAQPPAFNQYGGAVADGFSLTMTQPNAWSGAKVYYTTDGSDPRTPGAESGSLVPLVTEDDSCHVLVPSVANGGSALTIATWTNVEEPASGNWVTAPQGVGYERSTTGLLYTDQIGNDVGAALYNVNQSCYIRVPFTVSSQGVLDALTSLTLRLKYDDSFVAYLNGEEIARDAALTPANPAWNSGALTSRADTAAVVFTDFNVTPWLSRLRVGNNMLAIHGLNAGTGSSDALWRAELTGGTSTANGPSSAAQVYTAPLALTDSVTVNARVFDGSRWSPLSSGAFVVATVPASAANVVVSELHYHPADPSAAEIAAGFTTSGNFEFIELQNIGATAVDLTGVAFTAGIAFFFDEALAPEVRALPPGGRTVLVSNAAAFAFRYGAAVPVAGSFTGSLNNDGETLTVLDAAGGIIRSFTWNDVAPWPTGADGDGFSLVLVRPETGPDHTIPQNWRTSAAPGGSPGGSDTAVFSGDPAADGDGDGHTAFLEFAQGTSDTDGSAAPAMSVQIGAGGFLTFSLQVNPAVEVVWTLAASGDLSDWEDVTAAFVRESLTTSPDGTALAVYRSLDPVAESGGRKFFRAVATGAVP